MPPPHPTAGLIACTLAALLALPLGQARAVPLANFLVTTTPPPLTTYKTVAAGPLVFATFYPPGWTAADQRPAVVFIHGGGWTAGDGKSFYPQARYFASRGAVTMSIEYRLEQPVGVSLGDCLADSKSALRYIRAHAGEFGIDPQRIAAFGDSAGGHLSAAIATCPGFDDPADDRKISPVPNALILCNPIVDLTDPAWIKNVIRGEAMQKKPRPEALVPDAAQTQQAEALSPLSNVRPGQPPAILLHGTKDTVVDPEQARKFAAAYTKAGNRCDLGWIQDARHAFIGVSYTAAEPVTVDAIRRTDSFLASLGWLQGEPTLEVSNPPAWQPRK